MDKEQLQERLERLHAELQGVDSVDQNELRVLRDLSVDIQELLEQGGEHRHLGYMKLGERLRESVEHLEASHPAITALMTQLADALAKMGI